MPEMTYKTLGKTGLQVSTMGFGAATLGNEYGDIDTETGKSAVHYTIDQGINYFDTSPYYGRTLSETRLGDALIGRREKVILATKCGRYDRELPHGFDFSAERITRSVDESLKRLQTDWIDVFKLHDIEFTHKSQILEESLPAMQKLKEQGKVRFIGVTGYPVHLLKEIIEAFDIDMILSYCHYNLLNTTLEDVLIPTAKQKGVGIVNASTLHMGILTQQGAPAWHPAPKRVHEAVQQAVQFCAEHGTNITQLALQFALNNPDVHSTLVGMRTVEEVKQNLDILGTQADPDILSEVRKILAPVKNVTWVEGLPENYEPNAQAKQS